MIEQERKRQYTGSYSAAMAVSIFNVVAGFSAASPEASVFHRNRPKSESRTTSIGFSRKG
jgi:hypothetical protein